MLCWYSFLVLVSCHVIENQEIGFTKGSKSGTASGWPFIGFQLHTCITCLEPLLNCQHCFYIIPILFAYFLVCHPYNVLHL